MQELGILEEFGNNVGKIKLYKGGNLQKINLMNYMKFSFVKNFIRP